MHKILRAAKASRTASGDGAASSSRSEQQASSPRGPINAIHQRNASANRPPLATDSGRQPQ
eukprot:6023803-Heterocapsa_arctica.AAC.1